MKPRKLKLGKWVSFKWVDSTSRFGWVDNPRACRCMQIQSLGIVVQANDRVLTVTTSCDANDQTFIDPLSVPWPVISDLRVLEQR